MTIQSILFAGVIVALPLSAFAESYHCRGELGVGYAAGGSNWRTREYDDARSQTYRIATTPHDAGTSAQRKTHPYVVYHLNTHFDYVCGDKDISGIIRCTGTGYNGDIVQFNFKTLRFIATWDAGSAMDNPPGGTPVWYMGSCSAD
jgi:hypothetical protein